tara:strand:+ start:196 stop:540 length:345 start_codon:yes stop_codon:yes gene_type:complete
MINYKGVKISITERRAQTGLTDNSQPICTFIIKGKWGRRAKVAFSLIARSASKGIALRCLRQLTRQCFGFFISMMVTYDLKSLAKVLLTDDTIPNAKRCLFTLAASQWILYLHG